MNNRVTLVVLCEDEFHGQFASAFLHRMDLPTVGRLRIRLAGNKAKVIEAFPDEVRALRKSNVRSQLLVLIDRDECSSTQISAKLSNRLKESGLDPDYSRDELLVVMPHWELENWALSLLGESIGERRDRNANRKVGDRGRLAARLLAVACRERRLPKDAVLSLAAACEDWTACRRRWSA